MGLVLSSGPALEPLTVSDVKAHLRLDSALGELAPGAPTAALAGAGAGNVDNGIHRYLITFVTADGETDAGSVSGPVTVADKTVNGKVQLTGIQIGGANVTSRKIYRTTAGGTDYLLLATIADNTTTTYLDNIADSSLGAGAPTSNTTVDPYLTTLINVARLTAEDITKRKFITQTWVHNLDRFPCGPVIELPLPPLQSVSSVQYIDSDGTTQTLSSSLYHVSTSRERGRVQLNDGETWPDIKTQRLDAVSITMAVGYGASRASVPAPIRHAMLLMIGHWYNQREDVVFGTIANEVPKASEFLLAPYKSWEF